MSSITSPSDYYAPVRITCLPLFFAEVGFDSPSTYVVAHPWALSEVFHQTTDAPSTWLHVPGHFTPCPVDFKLSHAHTAINQPCAIVLSKPRKPSGPHHVFPCHRSRPPSASCSYVIVIDATIVFYPTDIRINPSDCQVQPSRTFSDYNHATPYVVSAPHIFVHCLMLCDCMIMPRHALDSSEPNTFWPKIQNYSLWYICGGNFPL